MAVRQGCVGWVPWMKNRQARYSSAIEWKQVSLHVLTDGLTGDESRIL